MLIHFNRKGTLIPVEVTEGASLLEAALFFCKESIPEIPANCGGNCSCGTCHIHIDETMVDKLGEPKYNTPEKNILEYSPSYKEGISRLACQVVLKQEHDGLIVHLLDDELL